MKIGLVGLGAQALRRHCPAITSLGLPLAAVYDPSPAAVAAFEEKYAGVNVCSTVEELASLCDVADVVIPPSGHVRVFNELVDFGRPFISEKPFCRSWLEAREIAERVAARGLRAAYLESWIFDPAVIHLRSILSRGSLGLLQRVWISHPNSGLAIYPRQNAWRAIADEGGGALLDWGSHGVGLAWYFAGLSSSVIGVTAIDVRASQRRTLAGGRFQETDVEDIAVFELAFRTPSGRVIVANIDSSWGHSWMWSPGYRYTLYRVEGSSGAAEVRAENTEEGRRYLLNVDMRESTGAIDLGLLKDSDPTASALGNALSGIADASQPRPESSLEFATGIQMVLDSVRLSANRGATVAPAEFVHDIRSIERRCGDG